MALVDESNLLIDALCPSQHVFDVTWVEPIRSREYSVLLKDTYTAPLTGEALNQRALALKEPSRHHCATALLNQYIISYTGSGTTTFIVFL